MQSLWTELSRQDMKPATVEQMPKHGIQRDEKASCVFQEDEMTTVYYFDSLMVFSEKGSVIDKLKEDLSNKFWIQNLGTP